jgi:NADH-quinone oxidoreductase subunit J
MAGIVGAAHIGKHKKRYLHRFLQNGDSNINAAEMNVEKKEEVITN